ncbi:polyamine-modulated factor 1-binding protein 1 isoform X2 [Passer domesticus]
MVLPTMREWTKFGTSREVPASQDQPEGSCRDLPGAKETTPELTSSIQQLQQETEAWQAKVQRQAQALEPQHGEARACQHTQQEDLDPAEVLATIQALQLDLDFCRGTNHKQLVQLQEQECAAEQEHQDLVILMQEFQALLGKVSDAPLHLKDQAVQTEVTSYLAGHSYFDISHDIPQESRELLKQGRAHSTRPAEALPSLQLGAQEQSQGLQYSPARLQEQLAATRAQEQQGLQQLSRTNEAIQGLQRKVAELQQQLCWQVQDMEKLQAELAQARQESTKQAEKIAAYKTQRHQLHRELRRMQTFKEQSKQETYSLQERLQELSSLVQHWQQLHLDSEQTLALREEELVVCKVELAFLKEELSKVTEREQDTRRHSRHTRLYRATT